MLEENKVNHYLDFFDLAPEELMSLFSLAKERVLKEGDVYVKEGSTTGKLAYIKSGLIRCFLLKENGEETTVLLRWEDQFFTAYDTVLFNQASRFTYQAMEHTVLLEADYQVFMDFLNNNSKFSKAKDYFLISMLAEMMERVESFVLLNPEERYLRLLKDKPNIVQRCPDKYIATLLGITPVSLSRIRKRLTNSSVAVPQKMK